MRQQMDDYYVHTRCLFKKFLFDGATSNFDYFEQQCLGKTFKMIRIHIFNVLVS